MRKASAEGGRRSLLPRKNSNAQPSATSTSVSSRQTSAHSTRDGHARVQAGHHDYGSAEFPLVQHTHHGTLEHSLQEADETPLVNREWMDRMQPPANVGRSISTMGRLDEDNSVPVSHSIVSSARASGQQSTASRIATPRTVKAHNAGTTRPLIGEAPLSPLSNTTNHMVGMSVDSGPTLSLHNTSKSTSDPAGLSRKASITRANIAVSRHARSSSQQLPNKPLSDIKGSSRPDISAKSKVSNDQRPAFSTYQQHFTPRKGTKASTASFLVQPSSKDAADDDLLPDSTYLQIELAQLNLLHRSSNAIQMEWQQSAQASFKRKLQQLSKQQTIVQGLEREKEASIEYPALKDWSQSAPSIEFAERIQILSRNLRDICILLDSAGRYHRVVGDFESWFASASHIHDARNYSTRYAKTEPAFVEDLGDDWKADVASLERKITTASRELQRLGKPPEGSKIANIMSLLKNVTGSMLEELGSMRTIERDLVMLENSWIEQEVSKITLDLESENDIAELSSGSGIWHR